MEFDGPIKVLVLFLCPCPCLNRKKDQWPSDLGPILMPGSIFIKRITHHAVGPASGCSVECALAFAHSSRALFPLRSKLGSFKLKDFVNKGLGSWHRRLAEQSHPLPHQFRYAQRLSVRKACLRVLS